MPIVEVEKKKQVIGLYGEMQLAMILHEKGWQVHRGYIDEGIDFVITKYWCPKCQRYSNQFLRNAVYNGKRHKCVTNLCEHCQETKLDIISRYLQVKTSEGIETDDTNVRVFSFHPKIRYDMGNSIYYVWIAIFEENNENNEIPKKKCHFYIFHSSDVSKFDDISIDTYQITDNQKTSLRIDTDGRVLNKGRVYDFTCFNDEFLNNFDVLEKNHNNE